MPLPTLQPSNPESWYKWFMMAILVIMALILIRCKSCSTEAVIINEPDSTSIFKQWIKAGMKDRDSLLTIANKKDSIRTIFVQRYRIIKGDSIPCEQLLPMLVNICDSIIYTDSSEISSLKAVILIDSLVIGNYRKVAVLDSNTIVGLKKEVKRQRNKTKLALVLAGVLGGIAILK